MNICQKCKEEFEDPCCKKCLQATRGISNTVKQNKIIWYLKRINSLRILFKMLVNLFANYKEIVRDYDRVENNKTYKLSVSNKQVLIRVVYADGTIRNHSSGLDPEAVWPKKESEPRYQLNRSLAGMWDAGYKGGMNQTAKLIKQEKETINKSEDRNIPIISTYNKSKVLDGVETFAIGQVKRKVLG